MATGYSIEKLKGRSNYHDWKFAVENYLIHEDMWDYVDGTIDVESSEENKKMSLKIKARIVLFLDPICFAHVRETRTAKAAWDKLEAAFDDKGLSRRVGLLRKLITTKLEECPSLEIYVNHIVDTAHKLSSIGMKVSEEWVGTLLLSGLPEKYSPMVMGLESSGIPINGDVIKTKLLQEIKNDELGLAMHVCETAERKALKKRKPEQELKNSGKTTVKCGSLDQNEDSKRINAVFLTSLASSAVLSRGDWLIDSGASRHMSFRKDWMKDFKECLNDSVVIADSTNLIVSGQGDVNINVSCDRTKRKLVLADVQYIPDLRMNLISASALCSNGYKVVFEGKSCSIIKNGSLEASGSLLSNGIFKLDRSEVLAMNVESANLWHKRLGHPSKEVMSKMKAGVVEGVRFEGMSTKCQSCVEGKHQRIHFPNSTSKASELLELVHSDLCGPIEEKSIGGARYLLTFVDDYSRMVFTYFLKKKSEVSKRFKEFKILVEKQTGKCVKTLRTDNGTEYCNEAMDDFLKKNGIVHQVSAPYTPEQNGKAERMNRTIIEKTRCLLFESKLSKVFWAEAASTASYLINRTPSRVIDFKTPYEIFYKKIPSVSHFKIFGSKAMYHIPRQKRRKLDKKSSEAIFMGYAENSKAYRLYDTEKKTIVVSRNVVFFEDDQVMKESKTNTSVNLMLEENEVPELTHNDGIRHQENEVPELTHNDDIPDDDDEDTFFECSDEEVEEIFVPDQDCREPEVQFQDIPVQEVRRSERRNKGQQPNRYVANVASSKSQDSPLTYKEAINGTESKFWKTAIQEELDSLVKNKTWENAVVPKDKKPLKCKWIFKKKFDNNGDIIKYKARFVAKGYNQKEGIDFSETFAPVVRYESIRFLLALAVQNNYHIHQIDAVTAFLQGDLHDEVYIFPPEGFEGEGKTLRLKKALYGLKQAPRMWNLTLDECLQSMNLKQSALDPCVYFNKDDGEVIIVAVYVDDILLFSSSLVKLECFKRNLMSKFEMKDLGEASSFLGVNLEYEKDKGVLAIDQRKFIEDVLERFQMTECNPVSTPMDCQQKLDKSFSPNTEKEKEEMSTAPYQELVGSLLFIANVSRPDISFAVNFLSRFCKNPGKAHWIALKRILRYLKGSSDKKMHFRRGSDDQSKSVIGFSDSDFAGDLDERKSTSGFVFKMAGGCISWRSKKQATVALSTAEAEFVAVSAAMQELLWLRSFQRELLGSEEITLYCDNKSAICMAMNQSYSTRTKHIDIKHNFVQDSIKNGKCVLNYVNTNSMQADVFTKPLPSGRFGELRKMLGIS